MQASASPFAKAAVFISSLFSGHRHVVESEGTYLQYGCKGARGIALTIFASCIVKDAVSLYRNPMDAYLKSILRTQFEAALAMLHDCVAKCPPDHWNGKIANYPFWQVAYHTLSFTDFYLSESEEAFQPRAFHPSRAPGEPFDDEPVRPQGFTPDEILNYLALCRQKAVDAVAAENSKSLQRPCGFRRRLFSRGELHIYNLRHVQHHAGQLSAYLRRLGVDSRWIGSSWK
jgi:hypothetical protein